MIPRKTYIPHIPAFVYLVCFLQPKYTAVGSFSWHYFQPSSLLCISLFSVSIDTNLNFNIMFSSTYFYKFSIKILQSDIFISVSIDTNLNFNIMFSSTYFYKFSIKILQSDIFTATFQHLQSFGNKWSQCVIHNISIATDDDIIQFDDDVNVYPVYYPGQLSFVEIVLIG